MDTLVRIKDHLVKVGAIENISMVQNDFEASIFRANFQNVNF